MLFSRLLNLHGNFCTIIIVYMTCNLLEVSVRMVFKFNFSGWFILNFSTSINSPNCLFLFSGLCVKFLLVTNYTHILGEHVSSFLELFDFLLQLLLVQF